MIAEFEAELARARTREGMAVARAKGRLRGKQPKLTPNQEAHLVGGLYRAGDHTISELAELFGVTRSTVYALSFARAQPPHQREKSRRSQRGSGRGSGGRGGIRERLRMLNRTDHDGARATSPKPGIAPGSNLDAASSFGRRESGR